MLIRLLKSPLLILTLVVAVSAAAREKAENWLEVRSPHFIVVSNANLKQARRAADQFERIRAVFHIAFPHMRVDANAPIIVLAGKDERSLKTLLPEYWEEKGRLHPDGIFLRGPEKNYVALRLDAQGDNPYHTIYHEYVHFLTDQNGGAMPLWLNEGLAEFYGYSEIHEKEVELGRPSESYVLLLRENKLLPLETLFAVDYSSPYYNEENKGTIFYAESWALTHYLSIKGYQEHKSQLADFLRLLSEGVETNAAAPRAFGDLKKLEKDLEAYVRQSSFGGYRMKGSTEVDEKKFADRDLAPAESAALRGDFLLHHQRYTEAKVLLEEALREDAKNAPAHESMGFLEFQQGHHEEAKKEFAEAVKLDSKSYLAHYYFAVMTLQGSTDSDASARVESSLRSAIKINPTFAPAYDVLATFYGMRGENLDEAHMLSLQACQLEPRNVRYFLNGGTILLRMNRPDDALRVGERALTIANSDGERAAVQAFLESARRHKEYLAAGAQAEEARAAAGERQPAERQKAISNPTGRVEETAPPTLRHRDDMARGQRDVIEGRIRDVKCSAPALLDLTLDSPVGTLKLHADNYFKVEYKAVNFTPSGELQPCKQLEGMKARIIFAGFKGRPNTGEIISVELRK